MNERTQKAVNIGGLAGSWYDAEEDKIFPLKTFLWGQIGNREYEGPDVERAPHLEQLDSIRVEYEYNILWVSQEATSAEVFNKPFVPYIRQDIFSKYSLVQAAGYSVRILARRAKLNCSLRRCTMRGM